MKYDDRRKYDEFLSAVSSTRVITILFRRGDENASLTENMPKSNSSASIFYTC